MQAIFMNSFFQRTQLASGALLLSSGLCGVAAWAQAANGPQGFEADRALADVTVTGNPLGASMWTTPADAISGTALLLRRKGSLGETLDGLPGVGSTYFGPVASRPTLRGQAGDRIGVLQNGAVSLDASGLSFDHAVAIDPLVIERVEILRGPGALQYGGSAVGGVVNIIHHRIQDTPLFDATGGVAGKAELRAGGAESERAGSMLLETGTDQYTLHVDAFDRKTGDVHVPQTLACDRSASGVPSRSGRLCNSASTAQGGAVGGTLYFDRAYLGASLETHRTRYGSVAEDTVTIDMRQNRAVVQGEVRGLNGPFQSLKGQWSAVDYAHTELDLGVPGTRFSKAGSDLRLEARQQRGQWMGSAWDGMVGVQLEGSRFAADGDEAFAPHTRTGSKAVFTHQELGTSWGKWSAGLRSEAVAVDSLGNPGVDRFALGRHSFQPNSLALGALWNAGGKDSGWVATGNLAHTERAPRDYELYANGPHLATAAYEVGNPELGKERATNLDAGLAWKRDAHRWGMNAFVNQFANYISLEPTGNARGVDGLAGSLPEYAYRQVRARFSGFESTGQVRLMGAQGLAAASSTLDLALKADLVRATNLATGQALPRIAPWRLGAVLTWAERSGEQGWGARLGWDYHAAQNRVPAGDRTTAGYSFWHASATYGMKAGATHWLWFARLDNASNQLAYSATSILTQSAPGRVPLPGRSLRMGVQAAF